MFPSQQWIKYLVQDLSQQPFGEVRPLSYHHLSPQSSLTSSQGFSLHTTMGNLVWKWGTLCHCVICSPSLQGHRQKMPLIFRFICLKLLKAVFGRSFLTVSLAALGRLTLNPPLAPISHRDWRYVQHWAVLFAPASPFHQHRKEDGKVTPSAAGGWRASRK